MADPAERQPIPLARPDVSELEVELVLRVLAGDTLSIGPMVEEFEIALAKVTGMAHAVACSSGTAGLHMAVRGLGIGEGDEVITTPFSFVASANCLLYERARPVFVDIEEETLGLDPAAIEAAATNRTRGILPVHVFGKPCRIEAIAEIAAANAWRLIEDACEALGSTVGSRAAGSFGEVGVFAFYPNKQITTGEGGAVVCGDPALAEALRSMRNQGRDASGTWMRHIQLGFNYRMDELSAALGVGQLRRREELHRRRARVVAWYAERLGEFDWLTLPVADTGTEVDWFVYVVRLDPRHDRDAVIASLAEHGIPARDYFRPIHLQPFYRTEFGYRPGDFPVTERVARSTVALPFSTQMTADDVDVVASALEVVVAGARTTSTA